MEQLIEAQSPEWYAARLSNFSASKAYELIKKTRKKIRPYILEKAAEILTGQTQENEYVSPAMLHGIENEPLALKWYAKLTGQTIEDKSYWKQHPSLSFGATCDRIAFQGDEKIVLEVKCPSSKVHIEYCLMDDEHDLKELEPDYYWQIVSGCLCHGTNYATFISFDPRIDSDCGMFILPFVVPDDDLIELTEAIVKAEKELNELITKLKGQTPQLTV